MQVSLFALSFWSFHFASLCAFGLLAYVGYIIYAFPSLFRLHRLNGLLLVFILFWAVSTYIFNVAFTFLNWKLGRVIMSFIVAIFIRQVLIWIPVNSWYLFTRTWKSGRWWVCGTIQYLGFFCLLNFVWEFWWHWVILWTILFSSACLMRVDKL